MRTNQSVPVDIRIPIIAAMTGMTVFLLAIYFGWMGEPAGAGAGFCEIGHGGKIIQPVNTWSNLGFIAVGFIIAWQQRQQRFPAGRNPFNNGAFFSTFYATLAVLLGPGSMAMHATTTYVGGFLDLLSMYMIASFITSYALKRLFRLKVKGFIGIFSSLLAFCIFCHFQDVKPPIVGHFGSFIFGSLLIISAILELILLLARGQKIKVFFGLGSIATMGLAFFIWNMSLTGMPWCDPSSLIQGHGVWHLLNAVSIYLLYRYYVSESEPATWSSSI
jgi:hypothetical protein